MAVVRDQVVVLRGGLDLKTPTLSLPPGRCRDAVNFEIEVTGGYTRIGGYERLDGQTAPSSASYAIVQVTSFTNTPSIGDTLTGNSSGATGQIIALGSNYMILTLVTLSFTTSEVVKVGATVIGTATPLTVSISSLLNAQYLNAAADVYRALITAIPGSGPTRGVVSTLISGVLKIFGFRDNVGATATDIYVATAGGWVQVPMFDEVAFTAGGVSAPAEGATLTQGANTATIKRVVLESGTWASSTAAGRFIITAPVPGSFAAGAATIGAITCTLSGVETAITITPGGTYEFDLGNFAGQAASRRIYGANGVGYCFEFDGTILVPIHTGFSPDAPKHIIVHRNHLFVGIGSSIGNSGIGAPYNWTALAGAAEIAVGDTVTGMVVQPGMQATPTLFVSSSNNSHMLYGTSATGTNPWSLVTFNTGTGAIARSLQNFNDTYVLDDRGVISIKTALEFGNFLQSALTQNIQQFIVDKRSTFVASSLNKDKSQYRLFFSSGYGLYLTIVNGKHLGSMPILFPDPVTCAWQGEDASGNPVSYFGSSNGMVYQFDRGSSFDGEAINASLLLNIDVIKSPRVRKRYRRASVELLGTYYAAFSFGYSLGYGTSEINQPNADSYTANLSAVPMWDSFVWDQFNWDGRILSPSEVEMKGTAENYQITIRTETDYIYPFTINSTIVHYSDRRRVR